MTLQQHIEKPADMYQSKNRVLCQESLTGTRFFCVSCNEGETHISAVNGYNDYLAYDFRTKGAFNR